MLKHLKKHIQSYCENSGTMLPTFSSTSRTFRPFTTYKTFSFCGWNSSLIQWIHTKVLPSSEAAESSSEGLILALLPTNLQKVDTYSRHTFLSNFLHALQHFTLSPSSTNLLYGEHGKQCLGSSWQSWCVMLIQGSHIFHTIKFPDFSLKFNWHF